MANRTESDLAHSGLIAGGGRRFSHALVPISLSASRLVGRDLRTGIDSGRLTLVLFRTRAPISVPLHTAHQGRASEKALAFTGTNPATEATAPGLRFIVRVHNLRTGV